MKRQQPGEGQGGPASCPFNANHEPAAPVTDEYPYNNAKNGLQEMAMAHLESLLWYVAASSECWSGFCADASSLGR